MNKIFKLFFCFFAMALYGQDNGKHEIKFDALNLVAFSHIQFTYEFHLNQNYSLGLSYKKHNNKNDNSDFDNGFLSNKIDYQIIPYFRYNIDSNKQRYYFIEAFASYNVGQNKTLQRLVENNVGYYQAVDSNYSDVAIGAAVGYKFYIKKVVLVEAFAGMGKNLLKGDDSPEAISRFGLNIGYRF